MILDTTRSHDESSVNVRKLDTSRVSTPVVASALARSSPPFESFSRSVRLAREPWRFPSPAEKRLYDKIDRAGEHLIDLCELGQGMQTRRERGLCRLLGLRRLESWAFPSAVELDSVARQLGSSKRSVSVRTRHMRSTSKTWLVTRTYRTP